MHQRGAQKEGGGGARKNMGGGPWGNVGAGVATGVRDCSFRSRNSALGLIIVIFTRPVYCGLWPHLSVLVKPNKMVGFESCSLPVLSHRTTPRGSAEKGKGKGKEKQKKMNYGDATY